MIVGKGSTTELLDEEQVRGLMRQALARTPLGGKRVLVIIPDGTRTAPLSVFFRILHEELGSTAGALDYLVALGTHQPMSDEALNHLVGITAQERTGKYGNVHIFNHRWDLPETFRTIGVISASEIAQLTGGLMHQDVPVSLNKLIFDYDQLVILGPVFPHEVVGFSGGGKYFFPGIGGSEIINFTHWLGAVITSYKVIGTRDTPVRQVINRAAAFIQTPTLCFAFVVAPAESHLGQGVVAGLFIGSPEEAHTAAADLSARLHVVYVDKPFRRVLAIMPTMYDDLWTAAKGMYKTEPAIADGGEVVIYAPHLTEVSYTHGKLIDQIGYHVRDYFLKQWDAFKDVPGGVLAHSTHLRGMGTYENGVERPRIQVTLATGIPEERCRRINLGYLDPATVDLSDWEGREDQGIKVVHKAGEMLYRLRPGSG
jgi:nickel-dependent lactate racemase